MQENNHPLDFPLTPVTYADTWQGIYLRAQNFPFLVHLRPVFLLAWLLWHVICTFCCCASGKPSTTLQIVTSHMVFIIRASFYGSNEMFLLALYYVKNDQLLKPMGTEVNSLLSLTLGYCMKPRYADWKFYSCIWWLSISSSIC